MLLNDVNGLGWDEKSKRDKKFENFMVTENNIQLMSAKTQALSTIRVLGRNPTGSDPLFTKKVSSNGLILSPTSYLQQYAYRG